MSKMGNEFNNRLEENAFEMYKALKELIAVIEDFRIGGCDIDRFTLRPTKQLITRIENIPSKDYKELHFTPEDDIEARNEVPKA